MRFNLLYCFLNSDNKERKYSTLFEAFTKCYTPLGKSPLWCIDKVKISENAMDKCRDITEIKIIH